MNSAAPNGIPGHLLRRRVGFVEIKTSSLWCSVGMLRLGVYPLENCRTGPPQSGKPVYSGCLVLKSVVSRPKGSGGGLWQAATGQVGLLGNLNRLSACWAVVWCRQRLVVRVWCSGKARAARFALGGCWFIQYHVQAWVMSGFWTHAGSLEFI